MKRGLTLLGVITFIFTLHAQDIQLPTPSKTSGKPLMETLNERRSERTYVKKEMPQQMLSDLLWTAYGFNREDRRTVPSSQNRQEIDVYVMFDDGIYFYDAKLNVLKNIKKGDFRAALNQADITMNAALSFIFVANLDRASSRDAAFTDTGYISQNIYLFAASMNLGTVARGSFNHEELARIMEISSEQIITLVQPVGFLK
ncbi:MAG: SagB/ThcOx family dehydrogenase [Candidatus Azobacteroides sp.]|nr:SagB/ThcOx family dehydrogenase [Candidatus Azobacteroides sp.]